MAVVSPVSQKLGQGTTVVTWTDVNTGDTVNHDALVGREGLAACVQMSSASWGDTTVALRGSNDGTTWVTLKDLGGADISMTGDGLVEFSTSTLYVKPVPSGGAGSEDVLVTVVTRG